MREQKRDAAFRIVAPCNDCGIRKYHEKHGKDDSPEYPAFAGKEFIHVCRAVTKQSKRRNGRKNKCVGNYLGNAHNSLSRRQNTFGRGMSHRTCSHTRLIRKDAARQPHTYRRRNAHAESTAHSLPQPKCGSKYISESTRQLVSAADKHEQSKHKIYRACRGDNGSAHSGNALLTAEYRKSHKQCKQSRAQRPGNAVCRHDVSHSGCLSHVSRAERRKDPANRKNYRCGFMTAGFQ